jgi:osmotically-inducible protein OsmY
MNALMVHENAVQSATTSEAARLRLRASPYRPLRGLSCECNHGVLLLSGRLTSFYYKQLAQEAVARVEGASSVVNQIEVTQ